MTDEEPGIHDLIATLTCKLEIIDARQATFEAQALDLLGEMPASREFAEAVGLLHMACERLEALEGRVRLVEQLLL